MTTETFTFKTTDGRQHTIRVSGPTPAKRQALAQFIANTSAQIKATPVRTLAGAR
jgi:hypothetical protein